MAGRAILDATARVTLTVELTSDGHWDENCTVKQIHDQASESAKNALRSALTERHGWRIIGDQKVVLMTSPVL